MKKIKKHFFSALIFIISLILIFYFIRKVDYEKFSVLINNLSNYLFLATYLICIIQTLINIKKFNLLISKKLDNTKLTKVFFISSFLNFLLPFKLGEIKKIYLLKKYFKIDYIKNIEVIIIDKLFELSSYIFFTIFIFTFYREINGFYIVLNILFVVIYFLFFKKIIFFLGKIKFNIFIKLKKLYLKYITKLKNLKKILILNIFHLFLTFIHFKFFLFFLGIDSLTLLNLIAFVSLISIVGFIPVTYNGLGFREYFILIVFSQVFTVEQIILIGIFFLSRTVPSAIIGALLFVENSIRK